MIQIPKGSVHIDIRELNLSINYLGELGLGDTEIPARCPLGCHFPAVNRAWERLSMENLPGQQRMGLGILGWGQREAAGQHVPVWHTQPLSCCAPCSAA